MRKKLSILAALAVLVVPALASAQSGGVNVSANVIDPLSWSTTRHLDFGYIVQGATKSIPASDASSSGLIVLSGGGMRDVSITWSLPSELLNASDASLAIDSWSGLYQIGATDVTTGTAFSPATDASLDLSFGGSESTTRTIAVRIGARVQAAANQPRGLYTGTVTFTAAYTGA